MFAAPPVIETTVFARIPERLWIDRPSHWVEFNQMGQKTTTFLEGPSFDLPGNLWVTDIPWGPLFNKCRKASLAVPDLYQLVLPPSYQLAGCKAIPSVHRVILFVGHPDSI